MAVDEAGHLKVVAAGAEVGLEQLGCVADGMGRVADGVGRRMAPSRQWQAMQSAAPRGARATGGWVRGRGSCARYQASLAKISRACSTRCVAVHAERLLDDVGRLHEAAGPRGATTAGGPGRVLGAVAHDTAGVGRLGHPQFEGTMTLGEAHGVGVGGGTEGPSPWGGRASRRGGVHDAVVVGAHVATVHVELGFVLVHLPDDVDLGDLSSLSRGMRTKRRICRGPISLNRRTSV